MRKTTSLLSLKYRYLSFRYCSPAKWKKCVSSKLLPMKCFYFSFPKEKAPRQSQDFPIFHFPSVERINLHLASGMLGEPSKTMQSTALPGSTLCFKRLTDTRVACRLDWQGLIVFNIPHLPRAVKFHFLTYPVHSSSRYLKLSVKNRL